MKENKKEKEKQLGRENDIFDTLLPYSDSIYTTLKRNMEIFDTKKLKRKAQLMGVGVDGGRFR